jgi:uncharacterized membrane protein YhaH (DUF805 family)
MSDTNIPAGNTDYRPRGNREPFDATVEAMGMMDYVKQVFSKYADFKGRARRSEYWYFRLFNFLVLIALYVPVLALVLADSKLVFLPLVLMGLYFMGAIIPNLAVAVRRLHDTGRSGWFYLLGLIPVVGDIIILIFTLEDSKPGTNQWGPNSKGIGNDAFDQDNF